MLHVYSTEQFKGRVINPCFVVNVMLIYRQTYKERDIKSHLHTLCMEVSDEYHWMFFSFTLTWMSNKSIHTVCLVLSPKFCEKSQV